MSVWDAVVGQPHFPRQAGVMDHVPEFAVNGDEAFRLGQVHADHRLRHVGGGGLEAKLVELPVLAILRQIPALTVELVLGLIAEVLDVSRNPAILVRHRI